MYVTVSGIIVFVIKWKTNLSMIKQKKSDQNNYPIKKYSTFCRGNEKWEISQTTVNDKTSAEYNDTTVRTQLQRILKGTIYQNNSKSFSNISKV